MSNILNIKDAQGNWHPVPYANGVTYTPSVDTEGVISWTNDGGKENPTPRNIKGADAVINGENTLTISAGENIEIEQEGSEMSIKVKNSKVINSESTDDTVPTSKTVYDFQDNAIESIESILPIGTSTGDIDDAKAYKMMGVTVEGKVVQDIAKITYKCVGTETGTYYFTYDNVNYQFTMPTITSNTVLVFDTVALKLYLGDTEIETIAGTSGTQITFIPSPNPDYPQPITQVSSATLKRTGKNMYEGSQDFSGIWNDANNWITDTDTYNGLIVKKRRYSWGGINKTLKVENGKTYTFSVFAKADSNKSCNIYIGGGEKVTHNATTVSVSTQWTRYSVEFEALADTTVRPRIENPSDSEAYTYICGYQLEEGTLTPYAQYQGQTISINLNGNTINAVSSTVHDNLLIDKKGNVAIERKVGKVVLDGSEDGWYKYSLTMICPIFSENSHTQYSICSHFVDAGSTWVSDDETNRGKYTITNTYNQFKCMPLTGVTVDEFKLWLSTHNIDLYYELATPTIIPLPKLTTLPTTVEGVNHVWVDTNIGRTNIEVKYVEDLQKKIQELSTALVAIGGEV